MRLIWNCNGLKPLSFLHCYHTRGPVSSLSIHNSTSFSHFKTLLLIFNMQALQKKQLEEQKMRELLATDGTRSIEERVEHCRALQYEEHQGLFAISHSSIHKAAADGSIDGLKYFLHSHRKPKVRIDDFDKNGFCPIHSAAIKGSNHSIQFLIDQGCNPDTRTTYGDTALMHACKENKLETIKLLFNLGAQVTLSNKAGTLYLCI